MWMPCNNTSSYFHTFFVGTQFVRTAVAFKKLRSSMALRLKYPDSSLSPFLSTQLTIGRGHPPCISDPACSRKQYLISPIEGVKDAVSLKVLGPNPACVGKIKSVSLRLLCSAILTDDILYPEIKQSSHRRGDGNEQDWKLSGFLETGQSQPVGVGFRFYILERTEETLIEVVIYVVFFSWFSQG